MRVFADNTVSVALPYYYKIGSNVRDGSPGACDDYVVTARRAHTPGAPLSRCARSEMEPGGDETPEERCARLLPENATVVDHFVLTVLLDPWTYLGWVVAILTPLVFLSAWASWVLMKDVGREKREKRAKKKAKNDKQAKAKAWAEWREARQSRDKKGN